MGAMNAMGHLTVAVAMAEASGKPDPIWDLLEELGERTGTAGPTVHAMSRETGEPRYCAHPDSRREIEFRDDDLQRALLLAATWKVQQMHVHELWRRD